MLKFDEKLHSYELNGKKLVSVTTVIKDVLKGESNYIGNQYAMDFGTCVHKTLELYDKKILAEYDSRMEPFIRAWEKFKNDYRITWMECEIKVASERLMLAGTIDRIAGMEDKLAIIEIKTGNEYKEHALQTSFYSILLEEDRFILTDKRICVYLSTKGYKVIEHIKQSDRDVCLSMLKVWEWKKGKLNENLS
jgi:hypothetical protein